MFPRRTDKRSGETTTQACPQSRVGIDDILAPEVCGVLKPNLVSIDDKDARARRRTRDNHSVVPRSLQGCSERAACVPFAIGTSCGRACNDLVPAGGRGECPRQRSCSEDQRVPRFKSSRARHRVMLPQPCA